MFVHRTLIILQKIKSISRVQTGPEAHPASCIMGTCSVSRGITAVAWHRSSTPSSAEVNERVELNLYFPQWDFMACYRVKFTLYNAFTKAMCLLDICLV